MAELPWWQRGVVYEIYVRITAEGVEVRSGEGIIVLLD